jgi:hypothetical protein
MRFGGAENYVSGSDTAHEESWDIDLKRLSKEKVEMI